jgi:hypothetical protein
MAKQKKDIEAELKEVTKKWSALADDYHILGLQLQDMTQKFNDSEASHSNTLEDFKAASKRWDESSKAITTSSPLLGAPQDILKAFYRILEERVRQDAKWGEQNHCDGTGAEYKQMADAARASCDRAAKEGRLTWKHILTEEFMEAMAESDVNKLENELIQTIAVGVSWLEAIWRRDRNGQKTPKQDTP